MPSARRLAGLAGSQGAADVPGPAKGGAAVLAGPAKPGPAKGGPAKGGPAKPGPAKPGPAKPGPAKPGPAKPCAAVLATPAKPCAAVLASPAKASAGGRGDSRGFAGRRSNGGKSPAADTAWA